MVVGNGIDRDDALRCELLAKIEQPLRGLHQRLPFEVELDLESGEVCDATANRKPKQKEEQLRLA